MNNNEPKPISTEGIPNERIPVIMDSLIWENLLLQKREFNRVLQEWTWKTDEGNLQAKDMMQFSVNDGLAIELLIRTAAHNNLGVQVRYLPNIIGINNDAHFSIEITQERGEGEPFGLLASAKSKSLSLATVMAVIAAFNLDIHAQHAALFPETKLIVPDDKISLN